MVDRACREPFLLIGPLFLLLMACGRKDESAPQTLQDSISITPLTSSGTAWGLPDWSPDGKWISYLQGKKGAFHAWIIPAAGGEARRLTHALDDMTSVARWAPDSRRLAFISSRGGEHLNIWTLSPFDDEERVFQVSTDADSVDCCALHWSPDGREIVFASRNGSGIWDIWVIPFAGGVARQVTDGPGYNWDPCWSPDGQWIAYNSATTTSSGSILSLVPAGGGTARQLTTETPSDWQPRWSPDGRWVAFVSARNSTQYGVMTSWIIPSTGGTAIQVGGALSGNGWSPDGTRIAATEASSEREIWRVPISGGAAVPLLEGGFRTTARKLAWSPDATRVAFAESGPDGDDIWTVSLETGARRQVTTGGVFGSDRHPWYDNLTWSPDSEQIAFTGIGPDGLDIWVVPATGGTPQRVTIASGGELTVAWSPDGETLAFALTEDDQTDIWTIPAVGGTAEPLVQWPGNQLVPVWSPDGDRIAFLHDPGTGDTGIWITPAHGGEATFLVDGFLPRRWSSDGTELIFWDHEALWKVSVSGGAPQLLIKGVDHYHEWSPDGRQILVARTPTDVVIADVTHIVR